LNQGFAIEQSQFSRSAMHDVSYCSNVLNMNKTRLRLSLERFICPEQMQTFQFVDDIQLCRTKNI